MLSRGSKKRRKERNPSPFFFSLLYVKLFIFLLLVGEGGDGTGEGQGFSDDGGGEAEEGPGSDGQGAEDEAGDGGMVNLWKRRCGWVGGEVWGQGRASAMGEDRGGERIEIEERACFFIKIIGWEALLLPKQKTQF
jgi:hypothetical protein